MIARRTAALLAAAAMALALGVGSPAFAADDYNVGDRVEFDPLGIGKWGPGVVILEDNNAYLVRADSPRPGTPGGEYTMPKVPSYEALMRRSTAPLPVDQQKNTAQPTGILDCPYEEGVESEKISKKTITGLIRCLYEFKNGVGTDGLGNDSKFTITSMKIGRTRPWRVNIDLGPGDLDTRIYPVKVKYTQNWWATSEVLTKKGTSIFGCYYSTLDEWTCGLNERVASGPIIRQPRG